MSIRLICFAGGLDNLKLMGTDISNAYLEAYTGDPLVFTAGPEFGELEGHTKACTWIIATNSSTESSMSYSLLFLLSVELLLISKVSKVSFVVGHKKGEELG